MQNNVRGSARARLRMQNLFARGSARRTLSFFGGILLLVGSAAAQNQPPVVSLTSPTAGAQFTAPASITLSANASDPNGTISRVRFYRGSTLLNTDTSAPYTFNWTNVAAGTYSITAQATDNANATTTSAAVSVTVVTTPNQPPTVSLTAPANGSSFTAPATVALSATAADANGTVSSVAFYRGSTLLGTDTTAPYTFNWTNVAAGTYSVTARATDNSNVTTTSASASITVSPPNQAPALTVNSPSNNQNFDAPATISFAIAASDADGSIARVELIEGGTNVLTTLTSAPYSYTWTGVPVGTKSIVVRAVDNLGANTERSLTLNVLGPNQLPSVSLTGPAPGTPFYAPASIPLSATASDADGTVASVAFYNGATLLGSDMTSPYTYNWTNAAAGSHTLTARVTDNRGGVSTSEPVAVTVLPAQTNPVVTLTAPADGAEFLAPAQFAVTAAAYGGAGTITKVDFFSGSSLITSDTSAPYTFTLTASSLGSYEIYARVTNSLGVTANSAPVRFSVVNNRTPLVQLTAPAAGTGFIAPASMTLQAQASDVDGTISSVSFYNGESLIGTVTSAPYTYVWNNVPAGSYLLRARATDNAGVTGMSAVTSITVAVDPNSPDPRVTLTAPAAGSSFVAPATIELTADALASAGRSIASVAFYSNGALLAQLGSAPYHFSWTNVPMGNYALTARVTDNLGVSTGSATTNISVTPSTTQPSVILTAPKADAKYLAPASLPVTALASGGAGTITKVEFYSGSNLILSDTNAPYTFTLNASGVGTYGIHAKVTNSLGETATSAPVPFEVVNNLPPAVAITSPAAGAAHGAGNPLPLAVNASDTGGSVVRVDYFIGSRRIATSTASPFSAVWAQPEAGYHQIAAVATDDAGATSRSSPVGITITDTAGQASAVITSPANGAQLERSGSLVVTAQASHPSRQITAVAFYAGQTLIGTDNAAPYYLNWLGAPAGQHVLTVRATDSVGDTVTSAPVTVQVVHGKPRLKLVSPRQSEILINTNPVTISMDLYDPGASVQRVVFSEGYSGSTIGVTTAAPHTLVLNNLVTGPHSIRAIAYDALDRPVSEEWIFFTLMTPAELTENPRVRFVSPQYGALVMGPSVNLAASAMGGLGHASVTRVEFHALTNHAPPLLLGTATNHPFEVTWNGAPKGEVRLQATAYFDNGQTQTDETRLSVYSPADPPEVELAYPEHGEEFPQGEDVPMTLYVTYPLDHLQRVDFYVNDQLAASVPRPNTDMNFEHILRNYPAGEYFLRAEAIGVNGLVGYTQGRSGPTGSAYPLAHVISIGDIACRPRIANHVSGTIFRAPHLQGGLQTLDLLVQADPCMGDVIQLGSGYYSLNFNQVPGPLPATLTSGDLADQYLPQNMPFKIWVERQNGGVRWSDQFNLGFVNEVRVGLTGLIDGGLYKATDALAITADVEDCSDCTTRVDFYAGQTLIGSTTTKPYTFNWSGASAGTHLITARAVDKFGQVVTSNQVTIEINQPPLVSIVQPTSPVVMSPTDSLQVTATASDGDGVYAVEFLLELNGSGQQQVIHIDLQAPYTLQWGAIPAGNHRIVARAVDYRWLNSDSEPLLLTVANNQAPVVSLLSPANGANFDDPANITIAANASDVDGNVVSVAFYADGNVLYSDTAAPYSYTWGGVVAGSYTVTAVATDNRGATSTTAPVTVVVRDNAVDSVIYIHTDIGGSPLAATGANGNVVWKENYLAYGQRRLVQPGSERQAQWFHGKEQDTTTGLQYFGARYYDPVIGRFLGIDPVGFQEYNLHSFNRYAYGNNNPVKYLDPDGRSAVLVATGMGVLVVGGVYYALAPPNKRQEMGASIGRLLRAIGSVLHSESSEAQPAGDAKGEPNEAAVKPGLPTDIVGDQSDPRAGPNKKGGKWTSGTLRPDKGGVGDFVKDLDHLTGGTRPWQPGDRARPGSLVGPNGISGGPNSSGGKSIDIPANGSKPHETLHYP